MTISKFWQLSTKAFTNQYLRSFFIGNPECVILDEPFANFDPSSQIRFKDIVKKQTENRTTTFFDFQP